MSEEVDEVVSEVVVVAEDPMMEEIRSQLRISSAVRQYLNAVEKLELVSKELEKSCQAVRDVIEPDARFVLRVGYNKHHLVTTDSDGNFNAEPIEVI